jgi:TRAP transporter TAXI family solute receptor
MPLTLSRRTLLRVLSVAPVAAGCQAVPATPAAVPAGEIDESPVEFSNLLVHELQVRGVDARLVETDENVENLRLVADGRAALGLALTDIVLMARRGEPPFPTPIDIRGVGRVYENYMQLAVRAEDPIEDVADLGGRRVSLGGHGSDTAVFGKRLLAVAGIDAQVGGQSVREAARALESGEIDALLWSDGVPTPALTKLARSRPVRLIPLQAYLQNLRERHGTAYGPATVPAGVYRSTGIVPTIGVAKLVVCNASLPDAVAGSVARTLVTSAAALVPPVALGTQYLDQRSLIGTGDVLLHPGAAAAYRDLHG